MSDTDIKLHAEWRTDFGKGAARALRRQGLIPAVMYGSGSEVRHVVLPAHDTTLALRVAQVVLKVDIDGNTLLVAPRDAQRHPVRGDLLHMDLVLLSDAEVAARHAYNDALELAKANAEEAGLDPLQAVSIVDEAYNNGEDILAAARSVVETLEEQAKAYAAAAAAAAAAEEAAGGEEATESGEEAAGEEGSGE